MSTFMANKANIERKWYVVDAAGKPLGKTAVIVADLLRGKGKVTYTPHADCGDNVIVINAGKAVLTGNKMEQKYYRTHSGWVGGLKGDQVPHPDAGEARAGHARGRPRHDAPQHRHQGLPEASAHLSPASSTIMPLRSPSWSGKEEKENVSVQEPLYVRHRPPEVLRGPCAPVPRTAPAPSPSTAATSMSTSVWRP